jgi:hypothetical protein
MSELGLKECFVLEPEVEKEGGDGGELGGGARRPSGRCDIAVGAPPRHRPVVV